MAMTMKVNSECDAVIVGAGPTGSLVAAKLAAAGLSVVILEAGDRYKGHNALENTEANAGKIMWHEPRNHVGGDFLHEALQLYKVELYAYQIMGTHWHLMLRPLVDGEMGRFCKWICGAHTMRHNAHYHMTGKGHLYQGRFKSFPIQDDEHFFVGSRYVERNALRAELVSRAEDWRWGSLWRWMQNPEPEPKLLSPWPIPRLPNWVDRVNEPLTDGELKAIRNCAQRGAPLGDEGWIEAIARRLDLESTMRPRGRPRVRPLPLDDQKKEV